MSHETTSKGYVIAGVAFIGLSLIVVAVFKLPWIIGLGPFMLGLGLLITSFLINGLPSLLGSLWSSAEPEWDGEVLHTDGGDAKVRYGYDPQGTPWFVAKDVCKAIGEKAPGNRAPHWKGVRLIQRNRLSCFSGESVKKFLSPLTMSNRDAQRLLVLLQNQVLRSAEREREKNQKIV